MVHILSSVGGFTGSETITTSCADVVVGPSVVSDGDGNPSAPKTKAVLSTVFFIDADAIDADCTVSVNGVALTASGGVDNVFSIVTPLPRLWTAAWGRRRRRGRRAHLRLYTAHRRRCAGAGGARRPRDGHPDGGHRRSRQRHRRERGRYMPLILLVSGDVFIDGELDVSAAAGGRYGTGNALGGAPGDRR
ncbi:MAG: hypothetical protein IPN01_12190 [Deltaproteobacteria bacterium]|nr:hypothetical protein [Deltaproteobacteria bacterium]